MKKISNCLKMKSSRKRIVALMLALLMVVTLIPSSLKALGAEADLFTGNNISMDSFELGATYQDENGKTQAIVIENGGDYTLPYDATVDLNMHFQVKDASAIDGNTDYIYTVPNGIRVDVDEEKPLVTSTGKTIGTVNISSSGKLTFNFDENELNGGDGVEFYVGFNGGFSSDFEEDGHKAQISFPTGAGNYTFGVTSEGKTEQGDDDNVKDVEVYKSGSLEIVDGKRYIKWNVQLNGGGRDSFGGQIIDNLPANVKYVDYNSLPASLKGAYAGGYPGVSNNIDDGAVEVNAQVNGNKLTIDVSNCNAYWTSDVTFYTEVLDSAFGETITNGTAITVDNSVVFNPDDDTTPAEGKGRVEIKPDMIRKSASVSGDTITWTVVINSSKFDIGGTTYEDVFGNNIDSIIDGLNGITISGTNATPVQTADGFKIDIPDNTNSTITLTYKTKVKEVTESTKNTAKLIGGDEPSFDVSAEAVVPGANMINKSFAGYDPIAHTLTWNITVNQDSKKLTNVKVTDSFKANGATDWEGTMEYVSVQGAELDPSSDVANGTLVFNLGNISTPVTITVVTKVTGDDAFEKSKGYTNNVELTSKEYPDPIPDEASTWLKLEKVSLISKEGTASSQNDGTITWKVTVNGQKQTPTAYTFEDLLPEKMKYVDGSFRIQEQWYDANPCYRKVNVVKDASGREKISYTFDKTADDKFLGKTDNTFEIIYETVVSDYVAADSNRDYVNHAKMKAEFPGNVTHEDETEATVTTVAGGALDKGFNYKKGNRDVTWNVTINEARTDMSDITNPRLTDRLADYFDYVEGKLYRLDAKGNKTEVPKNDYKVIVVNGMLTVKMPNIGSDCFLFQFTTRFNCLEANLPDDIVNKISLEGDGTFLETTSSSVENVSFSSAIAGATIKRDIQIMKVDKSNHSKVLEGAVFELYLADQQTLIGTATTDENGMAIFVDAGSLLGEVLYLKETEAPEGYKLNEDWIRIDDYDEAHLELDPATGRRYYAKQVENTSDAEENTGTIRVEKRDKADATVKLRGAEFSLYSNAACTALVTKKQTDEKGYVSFSNIPLGNYWLKETASPAGYKLDSTVTMVTITNDGDGVVVKYGADAASLVEVPNGLYIAVNEKAKASLKITKYDSDNKNTKLQGAKFEIYRDENCTSRVASATTDENGIITFDGLVLGRTYYYREVTAPAGYALDPTIRSFVAGSANDRQDVVIERELGNKLQRGGIAIHKTDDAVPTPKELQGVEFTLYSVDAGGNETAYMKNGMVYKVKTNVHGDAQFTDLPFGEYIIKEGSNSGYHPVADIHVTVEDTGFVDIEVVNEIIRFDLEILKLEKDDDDDDSNNKPLAGVRFGVYNDGGASIATKVTDKNGKISFENISIKDYTGDFTIKELSVPDGYIKANDVVIPNAEAREASTNKIAVQRTIKNEKQSGKLLVKKIDSGTDDGLAGAEFNLLDANKLKVATATSMTAEEAMTSGVAGAEEGSVYFENLKYGTYYLVETKAPANGDDIYLLNTIEYKVEITDNVVVTRVIGENNTTTGVIPNEKQKTAAPIVSFWFAKTDGEGEPLAGASFAMQRKLDEAGAWTTIATSVSNADGKVFFRRVSIADDPDTATYRIIETASPTGYAMDKDFVVDIPNKAWFAEEYSDSKTSPLSDANIKRLLENGLNGAEVSVKNDEILGMIQITKTIVNSTAKLEGAEFMLYDVNGNEISGITPKKTNDEGIVLFDKLPVGTYVVKEIGAPKGYTLSTQESRVVITDNTLKKVEFKDSPINLTISKRTLTGATELRGASLELRDSEGTLIDSWVSSTSAHKVKASLLTVGETYTLEEVSAPKGYAYSTKVVFEITETGAIVLNRDESDANASRNGQTIIMRDTPLDVNITKVDENGDPIPGAILEIIDANGVSVAKWTTNGKGYKAGPVLTAPKPGTGVKEYTLVERNAPAGYEIADEIKFTVSSDGTIKDADGHTITGITMQDKAKSGIYIRKLDDKYDDLIGAELTIYEGDDRTSPVASWKSARTPKKFVVGTGDGELHRNTEYVLIETGVPVGYVKAADIKFTVDDGGQITIISGGNDDTLNDDKDTINVIDKKLELKLKKTDAYGFILKGATLKLSVYDEQNYCADEENVILEEVVTGNSVISVDYKLLTAGTMYILEELHAPAGFMEADSIVFEIDAKGTVTRKYTIQNGHPVADNTYVADNTIVMEDEESGLSVGKIDKASPDGEPIYVAGSTLQLTTVDDPEFRDEFFVTKVWESEEYPMNWSINDFTPGCKYILTEIGAPDGYAYTDPIEFMVEEDTHDIVIETIPQENRTVFIADAKINLNVAKVDAVTNQPLAGAKFEILDADKKVVASWISTNKVKSVDTSKLLAGGSDTADYMVYTLHEAAAPKGYQVAEDVTFAIDRDGYMFTVTTGDDGAEVYTPISTTVGEAIINLIKISDEPQTVIRKQDVNGKNVSGAELTIYAKDESSSFEPITWNTSETPVMYIDTDKFTVSEKYIIQEKGTPSGYTYAGNIEFYYDVDGNLFIDGTQSDTRTITMINKKINVVISKQDSESGNELKGATLSIKNSDDEVIYTYESNGKPKLIPADTFSVSSEGLTYYVLEETKAPKGYKIAKPINFALDSAGNIYIKNSKGKYVPVSSEDGMLIMEDDREEETTTEETTTEETTTEQTPPEIEPPKPEGPNTGDNVPVPFIFMTGILALGGIIFILKKKKR
ncbi:MAG: LPXTG cell wall anchor domain-containing protein [Lachnospiraceae bacterium]|nr:LPXTG cell wall anchor domain-containing protein [Lachnospiraceae bacterium]